MGSGRAGVSLLGILCSIVPNVVLTHQSDPFRGGYDRAGSIMHDVKASPKNYEKDCNADGRIHRIDHEWLLADESGFDWILILCHRRKRTHRISALPLIVTPVLACPVPVVG